MKKIVTMLLALAMLLAMTACAGTPKGAAPDPAKETTALQAASEETTPDTRMITDGMDRNVEIP